MQKSQNYPLFPTQISLYSSSAISVTILERVHKMLRSRSCSKEQYKKVILLIRFKKNTQSLKQNIEKSRLVIDIFNRAKKLKFYFVFKKIK